jgi:HK97 family phage prohead protease
MPDIKDDTRTTKLYFPGRIKQAGEGRRFDGYASTASLDRDGEIILPTAFEKSIEAYMTAPVIIACHQMFTPDATPTIIGKVVDYRIDQKGLWIEFELAETDLAEQYYKLAKGGFLSGMSIGFMPKSWEDTRSADGSLGPRVYTEVELVEISLVAIPSNRDALIAQRGKAFGAELVDGLLESVKAATESKDPSPEPKGESPILERLKAIEERMLTRDELDEHFESFKSEILDPEGVYVRALVGRAGTSAEDRSDGPDDENLKSLLETTQAVGSRG